MSGHVGGSLAGSENCTQDNVFQRESNVPVAAKVVTKFCDIFANPKHGQFFADLRAINAPLRGPPVLQRRRSTHL